MSHFLVYPTEEIGKIMNRKVVTVRPDDAIRRAASLMEENNIGSVVVVQDSKPVGIVTERDFVRIVSRGQGSEAKVRDVMSVPPVTCESSRKVTDAFVIMATKRINHLPITQNGLLVGVVAARDLLAATLV